jgi:hypothetical protein
MPGRWQPLRSSPPPRRHTQELISHCAAVYEANRRSVLALEQHLEQYGYARPGDAVREPEGLQDANCAGGGAGACAWCARHTTPAWHVAPAQPPCHTPTTHQPPPPRRATCAHTRAQTCCSLLAMGWRMLACCPQARRCVLRCRCPRPPQQPQPASQPWGGRGAKRAGHRSQAVGDWPARCAAAGCGRLWRATDAAATGGAHCRQGGARQPGQQHVIHASWPVHQPWCRSAGQQVRNLLGRRQLRGRADGRACGANHRRSCRRRPGSARHARQQRRPWRDALCLPRPHAVVRDGGRGQPQHAHLWPHKHAASSSRRRAACCRRG